MGLGIVVFILFSIFFITTSLSRYFYGESPAFFIFSIRRVPPFLPFQFRSFLILLHRSKQAFITILQSLIHASSHLNVSSPFLSPPLSSQLF